MDQVFELFVSLGATDEQLDFPVIYASGRQGYAIRELGDERKDLGPLLDLIVEKVPPAAGDLDAPLCMQVATLDYDDYLGYMAIGRMRAGRMQGRRPRAARAPRRQARRSSASRRCSASRASSASSSPRRVAGDIVAVTGMEELNVGETITVDRAARRSCRCSRSTSRRSR